ncbi:MAG: cyclic nucleotide-binding domain-containing protein [Xanthobacteraceae bacterium]|nr:cyclic nucleotide-binding domain-containing protein [Xanthobacteraceae bacterium]
MPQRFDDRNPPFDRLTHDEVRELRAALDIGYFPPGTVIIEREHAADQLYVIIKGAVEERDGDALEAVLGRNESFDARALVHGTAGNRFLAAEETLCYLAPRTVILSLIQRNPGFAAFFYSDISRKLESYARGREAEGGFDSVMRARVRDARINPAAFIDATETLEAAGRKMSACDNNTLFVRDGDRIGIVTGMNLSKAVVLQRRPLDTPVRDLSHFDIVSVEQDDFIYEALIRMTRRSKRRLAVKANGEFVGVLEDIDILGLVAGNSQLIPGHIDRAQTVDDLAHAAFDIRAQVERLAKQRLRVEAIAEITSDLNRRLITRLFDLIAPPSIREAGCVMVMGSEGRGEQTVRTDQDDGLLLAAPVQASDLTDFRRAFTGALESFGFPPCPGNVMIKNPQWSQPVDDFIRQIKTWILTPDEHSAMNLGIFFDAVAVTGRTSLVDKAKTAMIDMMRGESAYLAHFARYIDQFAGASAGMLTSLMVSVGVTSDQIDIKKAGTFPIVHGIRTLAIEHAITPTPTARRAEALVARGVLGEQLGRDLISALAYFMDIRMRSQLRAVQTGRPETESLVHLAELTPSDRDLLRDALRVVKRFREIIRNRYHLGMF